MFKQAFEKTAVSMKWALTRIRNGVKHRANVVKGSELDKRIDFITRGSSMDGGVEGKP